MDLENNNLVSINGEEIPTLEILMMLTILMILPSLLTMVTSFVRIIIILSFTRNAIGIQQTPPNMVLVGIALFLTLFIMQPVIEQVNTEVYTPYKKGELTQTEALKEAQVPIKEFMLEHTEKSTFKLFVEMSGQEIEEEPRDQSLIVIIPAFMTSELKRGFTAGLLLYIPFLLLDIIVSSTLMSMGMIMLPPATIALPFKVLLFVSVDGWELLFSSIVKSFS
ncbi:MAG: flagellar type III secretion system pore protein FliP [Dorea sp.]|jgi:flagellar biosynthetic protein FliP|nr:flagellar type III secretion system pore protein FliP [Dorea sp.]MCI9247712.1 flagellar type III secretion system pore protein FliP [Dorea sp.]